jgi:hypothetical protein
VDGKDCLIFFSHQRGCHGQPVAAHGLMSGCREQSERQDEVAKRRRVAAPAPLAVDIHDNRRLQGDDNRKKYALIINDLQQYQSLPSHHISKNAAR